MNQQKREKKFHKRMCRTPSISGPLAYEADTLPTELPCPVTYSIYFHSHIGNENRPGSSSCVSVVVVVAAAVVVVVAVASAAVTAVVVELK